MRYLLALIASVVCLPALGATCYISEHQDTVGTIPVPDVAVANQTPVVFTTTSTQSSAFTDATAYIGLICTGKTHFLIGANPTATTNHLYIPADTLVYLGVTPGYEIAFIDGV